VVFEWADQKRDIGALVPVWHDGTEEENAHDCSSPVRRLFVIFWTVGAVLIGKSIESYISPDIGSIVLLGLFFVGLVVS
jgi:hypothetical protein